MERQGFANMNRNLIFRLFLSPGAFEALRYQPVTRLGERWFTPFRFEFLHSMTEESSTLFDRFDIQISNTERRNSSIAIQDCYIVYLIECRFVATSSPLVLSESCWLVLDRERL